MMKREDLVRLIDARWPGWPVCSTVQLTSAGLEDRALTAAVRNGVLLRPRRGAYVRSAHWYGTKPWVREELRIQAHYVTTGGSARYSHVSAARLHGCHVWDAGSLVHVTTAYGNSAKSAGADVKAHRLPLAAGDVTVLRFVDGREILTTSLERTVLDCARILPLAQAAVIGDSALRTGADLKTMWRMLEQSPVVRGSRRTAELLDALDARSESAGETRTRLLLKSFGIHGFQPQHEIPTRSGLFRADLADPAGRVVIEFDGKGKYSDYRPTDQVLLAERARENVLTEDGWLFLRLDWNHLGEPAELQRRVRATLARAQQRTYPHALPATA